MDKKSLKAFITIRCGMTIALEGIDGCEQYTL